jgi:hypothetical protein
MIINEALQQKYKVQFELSRQRGTMRDYFQKARENTDMIGKEYGIKFKYKKCPTRACTASSSPSAP